MIIADAPKRVEDAMNRIKAWLWGWAPVLIGLAAVLLIGGEALARAGGGDHFPGGGGGHGGGGGGGGGDSGGLFWLIWLVFNILPFPLNVGVVIAVVIGWVVWSRRRRSGGGAGMGPVENSYQPPLDAGPPEGGASYAPSGGGNIEAELEEFRRRDPLFGRQSFEDTVSTAFIKIQEAWSKRDMGLARAFLTPALLVRFQAQIDELKRMGRTNHVEQAVIGSVDLAEVSHDGGNDYLTARVVAAAADYTTDDKTGAIVAGTKTIRQFTEYWTFLRSDSVKTAQGKEQIASEHCPNCGAPIKITAVGKCEYCGSDVTTGHFSWVLSEITQASAYRPRAQSRRPENVSPLGGERYVLGLVRCPNCGANVQDIAGITTERCWRCGATVPTER
jgi:predicted lipid-binding transport protein (Tim44 family)